jgi:glycine betaine/proline transport system substrate-binding protein
LFRRKRVALLLVVTMIMVFALGGCSSNSAVTPDDQSVKAKFSGKIIGIDPGAGIMTTTDEAVEQYGLDYEVVEGSDATMAAALKTAIDNKEWVVVTGWAPHWKFARWDLKFLEDPKQVYGAEETINTIVRKGLKEDMPEVYAVCDAFHWDGQQIGAAMGLAEELGDDKLAARKWVQENQELVNGWLPEGYDAATTTTSFDKGLVKLLYVEWACARAETHVMADVLQNIMGYKVDMLPVGAAAMYEGLAVGEGDAFFTAWFPVTHGHYMEAVKDKVEDLGPNFEGARIGLVVPSYVTINSIEELMK